jgi:hypothetical protein
MLRARVRVSQGLARYGCTVRGSLEPVPRTHDLVSVCIGHELAGVSNMPQVGIGTPRGRELAGIKDRFMSVIIYV